MLSIIGAGNETFLYVNGLACNKEIHLNPSVTLLPSTSSFNFEVASKLVKSDIDFSIIVLSSESISSSLKIEASDAQELAVFSWNAQWDCILLGAIFNCEVMCNLQSDRNIDELDEATYINVTNYGFHGLLKSVYTLSEEDEKWIEKYYANASNLMENEKYSTAVHALASYRWHSMPRVQLAILWSGIESLFNISTEVSFRVSLYIALFLADNDNTVAKEIFNETKKLYNKRSSAVHGNKMKENIEDAVFDSASLLNRIVRHCAEVGYLPDVDNLLFN